MNDGPKKRHHKQMSSYSGVQLQHLMKDCGLKYYAQVAQVIKRSRPTVTNYMTGKQAIPAEIVTRLVKYLEQKTKLEQDKSNTTLASHVARLADYVEVKPSPMQHHNSGTHGRLVKRLEPPNAVTLKDYPPRMLTLRQRTVLRAALKSHALAQHARMRHVDEIRVREIRLELADVKALLDRVPAALPHRPITINRIEWRVISRALLHHAKVDPYARSFYQTYRGKRTQTNL